MIRHYECLNLLPNVHRTDAGYRQYGPRELHTLTFIRRARSLGFGMSEIADLLSLWRNPRRASSDVKRMARQHIDDLQTRLDQMMEMKQALEDLVRHCKGDDRPDCPILDGLAEHHPGT